MKMKECFRNKFNEMKVNANQSRGFGLYQVILERMLHQLVNLQDYHSRITIVRIDLHFPDGQALNHKHENKLLSRYIKKVKVDLGSTTWKNHKRIIHGWVKEIGASGKSHYHLFFGFQTLHLTLGAISGEGHTGMWKLLQDRWKEITGGTVHFTKPHNLNRGDTKAFEDCFYHLSYLAKVRDKEFCTGEDYRRFHFSRLKPKAKSPVIESHWAA